MQGSNTTHHDLITHAVSTNHHTKVGPYKRDVQHVRACMHDPMNTQGKHTRCSRCAYSECCATLVQCRLPTCFSGRYRWKSLALVQRPVAFPASYWTLCFKGLWFPKIPGVSCNTFPQWQNGFHARLHVSAANAPVQHFPSFRWLAGIRFPNSFSGPDRGWSRRRCTWTPQSAWQKTHQSISMRKDICKTSPVNNLIFFWKSTINHDMVTVGTGCLLPLLFWPTHCNSSVLSLQVEVNSLMSFLRPFELSLDSRLFQYNVEIHPALNWVPCLFRHSAATLIEGLGMGKTT